MKRFIIILLAISVCISVCACDDDDSDSQSDKYRKYRKYDDILDYLEDGNYQDAIDLIESMAEEVSDSSDLTSDTLSSTISNDIAFGDEISDVSEEPLLTPDQISWKSNAIGVWIPDKYVDEKHTGFTINEDGTCIVDGGNYTWEIGGASENSAQIIVYDGEDVVYRMHISNNGVHDYKQASLTICEGDNSQFTGGSYYRSDEYTVFEITNENWQEYFELKEELGVSKNAFDEICDFRGITYLSLKEKYRNINTSLSSGAVEYQGVSTCQDITVDVDNMTYTPSGDVKNTSDFNNANKLDVYGSGEDTNFGTTIGSFWAHDIDKNPTTTVWRPLDIEILRIQGTIYLINE